MKTLQAICKRIYTKLEITLKEHEWAAEGKLAAIQFALAHNTNVSVLQEEISTWQERITNATSGNPLASKTSSRIYSDSYLNSLRDMLVLITSYDYDDAIDRNPNDANVYFERGFSRFKNGDSAGAITDYTKAIQLNSKDPSLYFYRGLAHYYAGKLLEALQDYTESIRLRSDNPDTYYNRGLIYDQTGNLELAIRDYTEAIKIDPQRYTLYVGRGNAYFKAGDYTAAITDYSTAIRSYPSAIEAYYNRGRIFAEQGKIAEAIADYEKYLRYAVNATDRREVETEVTRLKQSMLPRSTT